jgi:hypothetical protein
MDKPAQQLGDLDRTGCYTLQCDLELLRAAVKQANYILLDIDLKGVKGRHNVFAALAGAINFPAGFGMNWDALADMLCDLSWLDAPGYVLLLRNADNTLGLSGHDWEIMQDIFADTALYWRQQQKAFWIFFT